MAPSDEMALTREALNRLVDDARNAGMPLNTWIDIRQLATLDDTVAKVAYRAVQEGLTNARRHASDAPVSLEVNANPESGVRIHVTNPLPNTTTGGAPAPLTTDVTVPPVSGPVVGPADVATGHDRPSGTGLPGVTARARSVGGDCHYGVDDRRIFHMDVILPRTWRSPDEQTVPIPHGTAIVP